ncbi:hypothetical protein LAZ67_14002389 [Cordylochernes scorpioides]|uniref:Mos1 transposase HTH domain-containing protein n=1 Tax=Cordylochernes scorpioides TaxID=51811 RepID=A0ABY6L704_9ARAC|nr:hypothetical protein LAZ67_14002389 [Cordylochernes scorpioides]
MELPLVNVSTCELRSVIRFFTAKNETAVNIHRNLVPVYGEGCMSIQMVRRWCSWFMEGQKNVHDDERSGRPVTATDNAAVAAVRNVVEADRRVTIDEIMIRLPPGIEIGRSSIGTIIVKSVVIYFGFVAAITAVEALGVSGAFGGSVAEATTAEAEPCADGLLEVEKHSVHHDPSAVAQSSEGVEVHLDEGGAGPVSFCRLYTIIVPSTSFVKKQSPIPHLLSENHNQQRMEAARAFLEMHRRDGDQLFSRIVTGDEIWVHHSTPETKRQSMVWKKPEESAPKKAKVTISAGKVMAIVIWDCKSVLLVDYLPPNTMVNAARYCEVLTELRAAIKRKRPGLLSRKVLLVHDNARPHAARTTQTLLENFKWEIFTHPPYSPDLVPSDFHLFPALKLHLGGKHFANDDEVQGKANYWLRRQDTAWYNSGINKLLQRY